MIPKEFVEWKQRRLRGASLRIVAPTGQYDPTKQSTGESSLGRQTGIGFLRRRGGWIVDAYGGVSFYTTNSAYYSIPEPGPQTQAPIGSFEGHLSYDFRKERMWASLDGNFWFGGVTALNSISNLATRQTGSRIGGTFALPFTKHQSLKFSYSDGTASASGATIRMCRSRGSTRGSARTSDSSNRLARARPQRL